MKISNKERRHDARGYCRFALLAGLGLALVGWIALPAAAQMTNRSQSQDYQVYPYYDQESNVRRETLVFPSPEERDLDTIYGYGGSDRLQPLVLERDTRDMGLRRGRFADPLADPRISPGTDQHYGYLHGYDYRYEPGVGARSGAGHQFMFNDDQSAHRYRRMATDGPDFRATYGRGAHGDGAGFYGYSGSPQVYGYHEPYRGPLDTFGYYEADQPGPQDYRPQRAPRAYDTPTDRGDRAAFDARWPQHLRQQQDPTPQLMPREQQAMRDQDLDRLQRYQQRHPLAFRQGPAWQEVEDYTHQWSDPMARRQREMLARDRQMTGEVYGFDDPAMRDPRSQDERWRDEERMRVMRERETHERQMQMNDQQRQQQGTYGYGYTERPPTAAGGRADDTRPWRFEQERQWRDDRRYTDEGRRWWVDRNGMTDQQTPAQRQPMTGAPDAGSGAADGTAGGTGGTDGAGTGGANGGATGGTGGGGQ